MAIKRQVFYSFHYKPDVHRVSQVRSIGAIGENKPAKDNDWETITKGGPATIEKWIDGQMKGRSCTVVLIGTNTTGRKWITHEISKSWNNGMGIVGIRIHGLKNLNGEISAKGGNPFSYVSFSGSGKKLSSVVECYNPQGSTSKERYAWIYNNLGDVIEKAIKIRRGYKQ